MDKIVLNTISEAELRRTIREELEDILADQAKVVSAREDLMSRQEVANYLKITLATVDAWSRKGILKRYEIESRVYFKQSEVEKALEARRKF
jgi:excisionase family DNA binding protein